MGIIEFGYLVATLLVGILPTVGYGVMSLTSPDFVIARRCFLGASFLFAGIGIVWGITTPETLWIRLTAVALVGAISLGGLTEALRWIKNRENVAATASAPVAPAPTISSQIALSDFRAQISKDKKLIILFHYENTGRSTARSIKVEANTGVGAIKDLHSAIDPPLPVIITSFSYFEDLPPGKGHDAKIEADHVLANAELSAINGKAFAALAFGTVNFLSDAGQVTERFDYWALRKPGEDLSGLTKMAPRPDFLPPSQLVPRN